MSGRNGVHFSYLIRFPDGDLVERFIDPKAQVDPYAYVRTRNDNEAA